MTLRGASRIALIDQTAERRNRHARWRTLAAVLAVCGMGAALAGCSWSWQLGSMSADDGDITGSIKPREATPSPLSPTLSQEDWRRAKAAMAVALDIQGNGKTVNWDNPDSGMKGAITPAGAPFVLKDDICRAFLADIHGKEGGESVQGSACKNGPDDWIIKDVKPYKKTA